MLLYAFILDYLLRLTTVATVAIPPASFGGYLVVMVVMTFFAFVLIHANEDRQLSLDRRTLERDLTWGILLGLFYWSEGLVTRTIVFDPKARPETNLGTTRAR